MDINRVAEQVHCDHSGDGVLPIELRSGKNHCLRIDIEKHRLASSVNDCLKDSLAHK